MATKEEVTAIHTRTAEIMVATGLLTKNALGAMRYDETKLGETLKAIREDPLLKDAHTAKSVFSKTAGDDPKDRDKPLADGASLTGWSASDVAAIATSPTINDLASERTGGTMIGRVSAMFAAAKANVTTRVADSMNGAQALLGGYRNDPDQGKGTEAAMNRAPQGEHGIRQQIISRGETQKGGCTPDDPELGNLTPGRTPAAAPARNNSCGRS